MLKLKPITFREACTFIELHHRHHDPPQGLKFCVGVVDSGGTLRGVGTAGRPIARHDQDGVTLEVNRTCTDGADNANSMIYGALRRAAWALGYTRLVTFTQEGESGASLRGAGFILVKELPARGNWAASSVKLKAIRNGSGPGGVIRYRWECVKGEVNE